MTLRAVTLSALNDASSILVQSKNEITLAQY